MQKRCFNPLLFCNHTTGAAITAVSSGISFHVIGVGVDNQRRSTIAENGHGRDGKDASKAVRLSIQGAQGGKA